MVNKSNAMKICKKCGDSYIPNSSRQKCCNKPITIPCVICGKPVSNICSFTKQKETCSIECQTALIKQRRESSAHKLTKKCLWCGKEFHPDNVREKYCKDTHYGKCSVCGKQFIINGRLDTSNKTCSNKCRYISAKENTDMEAMISTLKNTLISKYGVDNAMHIDGVLDKIKQTNLNKYGVEFYTQTQEYQDKAQKTSLDKYGVKHHLSSTEVIAKRTHTVKDKYGVDNVFQSNKIKDLTKATNLEKYGVEYITQSQEIQDKIVANNLNKYGVAHPMMLPEFKNKAIQTNFERYGYAYPNQSHISHINDWYEFINNPKDFILNHYDTTPRTADIAEYFNVDISTVDAYLNSNNAFDCIRRAKSLMEEEVYSYIKSLVPDCRIIENSRTIVTSDERMELDLYLPDYKFGIECNPTVTHNSTVGGPWGSNPKSISYHKHKTDKCEASGIFLYHIFGYEWTHKKDIVKSMIANILGVNTRIFARKCVITEVSPKEAKLFLQHNHRQGFAPSSIYLGLKYNDELFALMSFGKMRHTIGEDKSDTSNCYELVRFCTKLNTTVVGGADKLFKAFIRKYNPIEIRSFSDRAHAKGTIYQKLGFTELRRSDANYVWVNVATDKAYHRISAQKRNLKKFLKDNNIDLSQSERTIMTEHGFVQVYDSGTITWVWRS